MPLRLDPISFRNHRAYVLPYYGHGWAWRLPTGDTKPYKAWPAPFWIESTELIVWDQEVVGFIGQIEQPRHEFHGWHSAACLRFSKAIDLTHDIGDYLLWVSSMPMKQAVTKSRAVFQWIECEAFSPYLVGFGAVAQGPDYVQELEKRVAAAKRKVDET